MKYFQCNNPNKAITFVPEYSRMKHPKTKLFLKKTYLALSPSICALVVTTLFLIKN